MPVTVTIQDRDKKAAAEQAVPPAALDDYEMPGERREGTKAFAMWMLFIVVLVAGFSVAPATRGIGIGIFVWWLAACIGYFFVAPKIIMRRLRMQGNEIIVNAKSQPRLQAVLSKGSGVLGIASPEAYLLPEGISQIRIYTPPNFLLVTQATLDLLQPTEMDALILRHLVHFRQNHARRLMLMKLLNDTPPAARILIWPVGSYGFFLRMWWSDMAEMTADRLTLLLIKNHKVIASALLKQHAATDPLMGEHEITSQDVDAYIEQNGLISLEGREISTQYRLGQAIHENPYLEERLQALNNFAKSDEYKEALQRLADARAKKTGVPVVAAKS